MVAARSLVLCQAIHFPTVDSLYGSCLICFQIFSKLLPTVEDVTSMEQERELQLLNFSGELMREWRVGAPVRYVKVLS